MGYPVLPQLAEHSMFNQFMFRCREVTKEKLDVNLSLKEKATKVDLEKIVSKIKDFNK